ncbi:hypothetical protein M422DRAFT_38684 [Sphaerobolus stellatus SS14]|uniref:Cytochrome P450 n=1 Tax=Sphaerobolus stellatus (strain SS14) TaxID=990650 RepID=A0A0C9UJS6_SPHS4|nr:hypothetical protein M422DRAFT_38684 [Sphaerobolus stellatus SS14]
MPNAIAEVWTILREMNGASSVIYACLVSFSCGIVVYLIYGRESAKAPRPPLPPGPKPLPLLGNLLDMPVVALCVKYAEWGEKYGDVVHVRALGKHIIILNSYKAATELLHQRGSIHSSRPQTPMVHDPRLMDMDWSFVMKPYGSSWKQHRRLVVQHLGPALAGSLYTVQTESAYQLVKSVLDEPDSFEAHLRHAIGRVILGVSYGLKLQLSNDPHVAMAEKMTRLAGEGLEPKFLVNVFPFMKYIPEWMPGAGFRRLAAAARRATQELLDAPFEATKKEIAAGSTTQSFVRNALTETMDDSDANAQLLEDIKHVAGSMYAAGTDTTMAPIHQLFAVLVVFPNVQHRAQEELDHIIGGADSPSFRLPTFNDRPNLPYIEALLKEILRWTPGIGSGMPHLSIKEDIYRGWRIPKGSIIFANSWGILKDKNVYPDPYVFKPERFLPNENNTVQPDPTAAFGFGRRACPGKHLAESSLFIDIACLLAAFEFLPLKDKDGKDIDLKYVFEPGSGFILRPPAFSCTIRPRSNITERVVRDLEVMNG